ncbi:hypothetical protein CFK40_17535 [Virgibacillus necropolis]|uniref:GNAT family N-acetyltransferase n=1 Tax=Virgibacillus necropolis TaxID=163877 RepID=A0A221MGA9_9BACI|nr:hypothetical protein CFK40_17535 [Virgibacillus necropolis]
MLNSKKMKFFKGNVEDLDAIAVIYCNTFIGYDYTSDDINEAKQTIIKHSTYPGFQGIKYINESNKVVGFA